MVRCLHNVGVLVLNEPQVVRLIRFYEKLIKADEGDKECNYSPVSMPAKEKPANNMDRASPNFQWQGQRLALW